MWLMSGQLTLGMYNSLHLCRPGQTTCAEAEALAHRAIAARPSEQAAAIWLLAEREHVARPPALRHGRCSWTLEFVRWWHSAPIL